MNIFVVVPALNESKQIGIVLGDIKKVKLPIIVIDDGSLDTTYDIAKESSAIVLKHNINLGKGAAIKTGCEAAISLGADAMILMDSDGQHKASDIQKFIEKIEEEKYDIVFGSRNLNMGVPLVRFLGNKLASILMSFLFGIYISDSICGFRALSSKSFRKLNLEAIGYDVEIEMVIKTKRLGLKYCEVPVETVYYDKFKGVSIMDAFGILTNILKWRIYR